jgi:membrane-bound serine protease (ClpP class)
MIQRWWFLYLAIILFLVAFAAPSPPLEAQDSGPIYRVQIEGIMTRMTQGYLERALRLAEASSATLLLIEVGSEGAVLRDTRPMAALLHEAKVPVVVYIAPAGTDAGSGGAFFLSAAHVAAMAPDTSFGTPYPLAEVDQLLTEQTRNMVFDSVVQQLHDWNDRHGRNTDWVDRAVREGVILTNRQAFATSPPTVDIVAQDREELLTLLEGRTVQLADGTTATLATLGRDTTLVPPTLWEELLLMLADPTIMFFLLIMGCVAVYAEFIHPGVGVFAGIGVLMLLGALVGLVVLPVRALSLAGLVLAFGLILTDLFVPTHGGLTLTGLVLMIISSLTLIDTTQAPNVFIALWAVVLVAVFIAAFAALSIWLLVRLRGRPVTTGQEGLIGRLAEVRQTLDPEGLVFIEGALWRAICEQGRVEPGEWVRVVKVYELRLIVQPVQQSEARRPYTQEPEVP